MSEIRPTNSRPEIQRPQAERPVKTERRQPEQAAQQATQITETKHEVVKQEMHRTEKPKGGNVDVTV